MSNDDYIQQAFGLAMQNSTGLGQQSNVGIACVQSSSSYDQLRLMQQLSLSQQEPISQLIMAADKRENDDKILLLVEDEYEY